MASSPDVSGIMDNAKELDRLRKEQEDVLIEINKMHKKLQTSGLFLPPPPPLNYLIHFPKV